MSAIGRWVAAMIRPPPARCRLATAVSVAVLAALPAEEFGRLSAHLELVPLLLGIQIEEQPKGMERPSFIRMDPPRHDGQRLDRQAGRRLGLTY